MQTETQKQKVTVDRIVIENPTKDRHHALKAWIALILWLIVIAIESTTYLSSDETSRFLYPMLHFLFGIDWVTFQPWHHFLRKCGHVFGYALLSILLFRAWRETLPSKTGTKWTLRTPRAWRSSMLARRGEHTMS